jgi:hypothetical protein
MSSIPPPLLEIIAEPSTKPRVLMARELIPQEEYAIIVFAVIRALARWPDTWQEEIGRIAQSELEAQAANGGVYPEADEEGSL